MKNLRNRFERFCFDHRNLGIPNLMMYISIGSAIVYLMGLFNGGNVLYDLLCFDKALILQGQVWRLFTYVFTYSTNGYIILVAISLLCFFSLGRAMENSWGTFRFNLFYLTGIVLMDVFAMIFSPMDYELFQNGTEAMLFPASYYSSMVYNLNLTLLIGYATLYPDNHFLFLYVIPVKARIFGLLYLVLNLVDIFNLTYPITFFPHNLFPLVAMGNYFLFFGKDVLNLIPPAWRINASRLFRKKKKSSGGKKPIEFQAAGSYAAATAKVKAPYTHRCTVCGRTDVSNPELEFRYCSRCKGYFCYCEDHISNHNHIQ